MIDLLETNRAAIIRLCRQHHVARLDVFGSASSGRFQPSSDVDLLITMEDLDAVSYKRHYLAFWQKLEELLGRRVDLVSERFIRNLVFRGSVEVNRENLYAA